MGWEPERGKGVVSPGEGGDAAGGMCVYTVMLHLDDGSGAGWDDDDFLGDGALVCDSTTEAIEDLLDASPAAFGALPWEEQRRRLNLLIGKPRLWALTCDPRHGGWRIDSSVPLDVAPDPSADPYPTEGAVFVTVLVFSLSAHSVFPFFLRINQIGIKMESK